MTDYLPRPDKGRLYTHDRQVRLSDAGADGVLRLDGVARYLQDVAADDWAESGLDQSERWVVRRTSMRVADGGRWPELGERVTLVTWCAGTGPAWAERRTDLEVNGSVVVQAVALWVLLDSSGRPLRIGQAFQEVYGQSAGGRRVSGRITAVPVPDRAKSRPWPIRRADLDVVGHVNNAAVWAAVTEVANGEVTMAAVTHHGPVEGDHEVSVITQRGRMWLTTDSEVVVSAEFEPE
jgi:acyl-ACP thioesterase